MTHADQYREKKINYSTKNRMKWARVRYSPAKTVDTQKAMSTMELGMLASRLFERIPDEESKLDYCFGGGEI